MLRLNHLVGFGSGGGDPYWQNVSLLLHMNGSNGSTSFVDSSKNGLTVTANGSAKLTTTGPKFGSACGTFNGSSDWLSIAANALLQFGTGDFTVEGWQNPVNFSQYNPLFDSGYEAGGSSAGSLLIQAAATSGLIAVLCGGSVVAAETGAPSTGVYSHWAVVHHGTDMMIFRNGVLIVTGTDSTNLNKSSEVRIGYRVDNSVGPYYNGLHDEYRITKGVARYTASFGLQNFEFPNG